MSHVNGDKRRGWETLMTIFLCDFFCNNIYFSHSEIWDVPWIRDRNLYAVTGNMVVRFRSAKNCSGTGNVGCTQYQGQNYARGDRKYNRNVPECKNCSATKNTGCTQNWGPKSVCGDWKYSRNVLEHENFSVTKNTLFSGCRDQKYCYTGGNLGNCSVYKITVISSHGFWVA